ncbi:MAG TPA: ABC transporter permease [Sandaracinaceae bacterium LLY-WYZ-13_1]|nr:ABC transporter permease [Sandaracinaceae bacterium LLY-WYZ-13_1]
MAETVAKAEEEEPSGEPPEEPPSPEEAQPTWGEAFLEVGKSIMAVPTAILAEVGVMARLSYETFMWGIRPPYRFRLLVDMLEFLGVQSIFIVGLSGLFVGGVFSLQLVNGFRQFGAENQVGAVIGLALSRELAPVFSALMITSRAGSAMATEIASMRVTNQIDALTTMSVNPVQYLIVPRVLAATIATPIMALLAFLVGLSGAYLVGVELMGIDGGIFIQRVKWFVDTADVGQGLTKSAVFGAALTMIACRHGFYATGGAAGVGRATNRAVVQASVAILVLDYVLTAVILGEGAI